ncbi:MAG: flagellar motor switch protein FliG, partial [Beijerinckiaceae bacterium]|nr:flagellar motor switch protein FliG [Beijerinckiaceae bacterium]
MAASALALPPSKPLRGPEKVAVLLLAMDTQLASGLLKQFDPQELREITRSAADLGSVPVAALERLIEEFAGSFSNGADLVGSANGAETLLAGALPPEQVSDIMADVLGSANLSIWERLSNVSEQQLCTYLAG